MEELKKKKGILSKIKSLVAKTGRNIIWRGRPKDNEISEKIAQKIQKSSYDFSIMKRQDTFTPPYLSLAEQLQVDDDQIFNQILLNITCDNDFSLNGIGDIVRFENDRGV